jgi:hypothetical protein
MRRHNLSVTMYYAISVPGLSNLLCLEISFGYVNGKRKQMAGQNLFTDMREENFHRVAEIYTRKIHHQTQMKQFCSANTMQKQALLLGTDRDAERL